MEGETPTCGVDRSWSYLRNSFAPHARTVDALDSYMGSSVRRVRRNPHPLRYDEAAYSAITPVDLAPIPETYGFIAADRARRRPRRIGHLTRAEFPGPTSELHPHCWSAHPSPAGGYPRSPPHHAICDHDQGNLMTKSDFPYFDGECCNEDYLKWEQEVDEFFFYAGIPHTKQARYVVCKLTDRAKTWWALIRQARYLEGRSEVKSWRKMKSMLRSQFLTSDYKILSDEAKPSGVMEGIKKKYDSLEAELVQRSIEIYEDKPKLVQTQFNENLSEGIEIKNEDEVVEAGVEIPLVPEDIPIRAKVSFEGGNVMDRDTLTDKEIILNVIAVRKAWGYTIIDTTKEAKETLLEKQFFLLQKLLMDDCPEVRGVAVEGLCHILNLFYKVIPPLSIIKILRKLIDGMTCDICNEVRLSSLNGIIYLPEKLQSPELMKVLLPKLCFVISDPSLSVRFAAIDLLLVVGHIRHFQFNKVVSLDSIFSSLANDYERVAREISRPLIPSYFPSNLDPREACGRFSALMRRSLGLGARFCEFLLSESSSSKALMELLRFCFDLTLATNGISSKQIDGLLNASTNICTCLATELSHHKSLTGLFPVDKISSLFNAATSFRAWTANTEAYAYTKVSANATYYKFGDDSEDVQDAHKFFLEMQGSGLQPNVVTFLVFMFACGYRGSLEQGLHYMLLMTKVYSLHLKDEGLKNALVVNSIELHGTSYGFFMVEESHPQTAEIPNMVAERKSRVSNLSELGFPPKPGWRLMLLQGFELESSSF